MADHFDEKSGLVPSKTPWGSWAQAIDEVFNEVNVVKGTKGREGLDCRTPGLLEKLLPQSRSPAVVFFNAAPAVPQSVALLTNISRSLIHEPKQARYT